MTDGSEQLLIADEITPPPAAELSGTVANTKSSAPSRKTARRVLNTAAEYDRALAIPTFTPPSELPHISGEAVFIARGYLQHGPKGRLRSQKLLDEEKLTVFDPRLEARGLILQNLGIPPEESLVGKRFGAVSGLLFIDRSFQHGPRQSTLFLRERSARNIRNAIDTDRRTRGDFLRENPDADASAAFAGGICVHIKGDFVRASGPDSNSQTWLCTNIERVRIDRNTHIARNFDDTPATVKRAVSMPRPFMGGA